MVSDRISIEIKRKIENKEGAGWEGVSRLKLRGKKVRRCY
jgi:hypothetical protein